MPRVRDAVGGAADDRADAARYQGIDRRAPTDQHRIMIMDSMSDLFSELSVARPRVRRHAGRQGRARARVADGLRGIRSDGAGPARRQPDAGDGAGATSARGPFADRRRRRRHGHDRRPERQDRGAHAAEPRGDRSERPRHPRGARAVSGFPGADQSRETRRQRRVVELDERDGVPARRREVLHRQLPAREGVGEAASRERGRDLVHGIQLLAAAGVRLSGAARSLQLPAPGGRQRSMGEHRRRAPTSSASCAARRPTGSCRRCS